MFNFLSFNARKSYLHLNGVELNFLLIGMASVLTISFQINPRIREDSKGMVSRPCLRQLGQLQIQLWFKIVNRLLWVLVLGIIGQMIIFTDL